MTHQSSDQSITIDEDLKSADETLTWSRPTIRTLDLKDTTEGGSFTGGSPGDDGWYAS